MARRAAATLALGLGLMLAACGGTTTVTLPDGGDASQPRDTAADRGEEDGSPGDGPFVDGGDDAGPTSVPRFLSETAGGARLLSTNYRLELFVAPARPSGTTESPGYELKLGPGALRNAR